MRKFEMITYNDLIREVRIIKMSMEFLPDLNTAYGSIILLCILVTSILLGLIVISRLSNYYTQYEEAYCKQIDHGSLTPETSNIIEAIFIHLKKKLDTLRAKTIENRTFKKTQNELVKQHKQAHLLLDKLISKERHAPQDLRPTLQKEIQKMHTLIAELETAKKRLDDFVRQTEVTFADYKHCIEKLKTETLK